MLVRLPVLLAALTALAVVASACGSPDLTPTGAAATSTSFTTTTLPVDDSDSETTTTTTTEVPASTTTTTALPGGDGEPDPGLTDEVIRIAVIADVTSGEIGEQIFLPAWHGIDAWATAVNQFGGLAGRRVEVEFIDSAVVDHAEAIQTVCSGDFFAIVGSVALFDGDGVDILTSDSCAMPDFPAMTFSTGRRSSEVTFPPNPLLDDIVQAGPARELAASDPAAAQEAATFFTGLADFDVEVERVREAALANGFEFVYDPTILPGDDLAPIVASMEDLGVASVQWVGSGRSLAGLLSTVAATAGSDGEPTVDLSFVACTTLCYSPEIEALGGAAEGVTVWLPHLPLDEVELNAELNRYLFFLNLSAGEDEVREPHPIGVAAWSAGRLFEAVVNRAIGTGTASENAARLTRDAVLAAARVTNEFDASGLYAEPSNPQAGVPTPCFVLVAWDGAAWDRVHPAEPGSVDCSPDNLFFLDDETTPGIADSDGG